MERKRAHWMRATTALQRRWPQERLGAQLQRLIAALERARHALRDPAPLWPKQQKTPQATKAQTAQAQQKIAAKRGHPQQEQMQPVQQELAQQQEMAQEEQQQEENSLQSSLPEETRTPAMKVQKRQELQKFAARMGHRPQVLHLEWTQQEQEQREQEQQERQQPESQSWKLLRSQRIAKKGQQLQLAGLTEAKKALMCPQQVLPHAALFCVLTRAAAALPG
jgi:hypothetical protein